MEMIDDITGISGPGIPRSEPDDESLYIDLPAWELISVHEVIWSYDGSPYWLNLLPIWVPTIHTYYN